jgi:hypothetical protein
MSTATPATSLMQLQADLSVALLPRPPPKSAPSGPSFGIAGEGITTAPVPASGQHLPRWPNRTAGRRRWQPAIAAHFSAHRLQAPAMVRSCCEDAISVSVRCTLRRVAPTLRSKSGRSATPLALLHSPA